MVKCTTACNGLQPPVYCSIIHSAVLKLPPAWQGLYIYGVCVCIYIHIFVARLLKAGEATVLEWQRGETEEREPGEGARGWMETLDTGTAAVTRAGALV